VLAVLTATVAVSAPLPVLPAEESVIHDADDPAVQVHPAWDAIAMLCVVPPWGDVNDVGDMA
jgi:hypothetical protein